MIRDKNHVRTRGQAIERRRGRVLDGNIEGAAYGRAIDVGRANGNLRGADRKDATRRNAERNCQRCPDQIEGRCLVLCNSTVGSGRLWIFLKCAER